MTPDDGFDPSLVGMNSSNPYNQIARWVAGWLENLALATMHYAVTSKQ